MIVICFMCEGYGYKEVRCEPHLNIVEKVGRIECEACKGRGRLWQETKHIPLDQWRSDL